MNSTETRAIPALVSPYASLLRRFVAYILDAMVTGFISTIILNTLRPFFDFNPMTTILLGLVIYLTYFILLTRLNQGQTLGKMICGIRVIRRDGRELTWTDALLREGVARYIQERFRFLYFVALFTADHKQIGDYLTPTCVVNLEVTPYFIAHQEKKSVTE